ncbi:DUF2865 domain-containing protein [Methylobacterium sp. sgz302541]|uniref:DUF2865 domain-containing protein n=1 Tax=unclassified Methylobacterium TaxID=2615210 RepID=UPI003D34EB9C
MTLLGRWRRFAASGGTRRQMLGTALAGLILGLGSVTIGTSLVHASERQGLAGFFEALFGGQRPQAQVEPMQRVEAAKPRRYSSLPDARRLGHRPLLQRARRLGALRGEGVMRHRQVGGASSGVLAGSRTVCMRLCDGFLFPLGNLASKADIPVHESACAAACPGNETRLLTLAPGETELDRAVGLTGMPYRASALANVYRERKVENCSCQPVVGAAPLSLARDLTLRTGDVVATADSADVVTRIGRDGVAVQDFRSARGLSRNRSRQIEARVGALRRDEQARAFRRAMRLADRERVIQVASAGTGFEHAPRAGRPAVFASVRVVTPSPFSR